MSRNMVRRVMNFLRCSSVGSIACRVPAAQSGIAVAAFSFIAATSAAQTVANVVPTFVNSDRDVQLSYDLTAPTQQAYHVGVFFSLDNGATFISAPDHLSGDVGPGVTPGFGRSILWPEFSASLHPFAGQQVIFRVAARAGVEQAVVEFDTNITSATEGAGTAKIKLKASEPYFGLVKYNLTAMTNASVGSTTGTDVQGLTGQVSMAGTEAVIPLTILDDLQLEQPKAVTIDLVYEESLGYSVGPAFRHMLMLFDDDGAWSGTLMGSKVAEGEVPIRILLAKNDSTLSGTLVSRKHNAATLTSFPEGDWPLTVTWNGSRLEAVTANMPVPGSSLFPDSAEMSRKVVLTADATIDGHQVRLDSLIQGHFSDSTTGGATSSYLDSTTTGGFILVREMPSFVPPAAPAVPASGARSAGYSAAEAALEIPAQGDR